MTATGPLQQSLAARMKLVLQLAGDLLTADQRTTAESLYNDIPQAATSCSVPIIWDPSCPPDGATSHLMTQSQLCQDFVANVNTSPGATAAELTNCLGQLAKLGTTPETCRLAMRDSADATAQSVLERAQPSFAGDFATVLPLALSRIAAWWQAAAPLTGTDRTWFAGQSSALERWLYAAIEAQRSPLPNQPPANDTAAAQLLSDFAETKLTNDLSVLSFAYAPGQSLSAPPLLTITSDALQSMSDRLERLEPIHDAGCRFRPCRNVASPVDTPTSELVHVLAVLPDGAAFQSALAAATHLHAQKPAIYDALTKVRDQHLYLEAAWNLYGRSEPFSSLATVSNPPLEAAGLAAIVRSASQAWASYNTTGVFLPWNRPRLTAATLHQTDLVTFINNQASITDGQKTQYTEARFDTVKDLLDQSRSGQAAQSQADQADQQITHLRDIASRMDGLEQREQTERAALSGFQSVFETLINSGALNPNAQYRVDPIPSFTVTATASHYPGDGASNIVRESFHTEILTKGQTLRAHVTGQWSPTCAITNGNLLDQNTGLLFPTVVGQAETGPEGFFVTASLSSFSSGSIGVFSQGVTDHTVLTCSTSALNFGLCSLTNSPDDGNAAQGSLSIGREVSSSAAFNTGLRLSTTPYPQAPVGSLVAVITRKGATGGESDPAPLDVRVVNRDDVFTVATPPHLDGWPDDGQIEVHLVVNDRANNPDGSACARTDTAALTIELSRTTPLGTVAPTVGVAMSDALGKIEAQADAVIAQGVLSPTEAGALRNTAWQNVEDGLQGNGIGLSGLPQELHQLFDSYVERELASVDRRAQHNALRQEYVQVALQIDALKRQQAFVDTQDRLLHLTPRLRLRDLSGFKLSGSVASLAETLTSYAAPIFELRAPQASTDFVGLVNGEIDGLTSSLDITASYDGLVDGFVKFARDTANAIGSAPFEVPATQARTIIVAIPRPGNTGQITWNGPWRAVSVATAKAFWDSAVDSQGNPLPSATLTLSPVDLYSAGGGPSALNCGDLAPVVRHVGFYFETNGRPAILGPANVAIHTKAATTAALAFPLLHHMTTLEATDPLGIAMDVRALNGETAAVLVDALGNPGNFGVWPPALDAGAGISPFTSFQLDMRAFTPSVRDVLGHTTAMYAVFDVENLISNQDAWLPGVCASN